MYLLEISLHLVPWMKPPLCCHFAMVEGFACPSDPGSFVSGNSGPWQVQPCWIGLRQRDRLRTTPGPPDCGLGMGPTAPSCKHTILLQKPRQMQITTPSQAVWPTLTEATSRGLRVWQTVCSAQTKGPHWSMEFPNHVEWEPLCERMIKTCFDSKHCNLTITPYGYWHQSPKQTNDHPTSGHPQADMEITW